MKTLTTYLCLLTIALASLGALGTATTARADDGVMGTNRQTGGEAPGDRQAMQNILDGMRRLRN